MIVIQSVDFSFVEHDAIVLIAGHVVGNVVQHVVGHVENVPHGVT